MEKVTAKYYVVLKGKKGYLKDKERDRWYSSFNYVVNPNKDKAYSYTLKQMIGIKMAAKRHGVSLKVIRRVDVKTNTRDKEKPVRDVKKRANRYRENVLRKIKNNMEDLVEYEHKLVKAKQELLKYTKRLEGVNERLKPLMKHGEKGYSEPKSETSN